MRDENGNGNGWPGDRPELLPFVPMVLSVWADGVLTPEEAQALRAQVTSLGCLDEDARASLFAWLDPGAPPTPSALERLGARVREAGVASDAAATASLTELGLALWRRAGEDPCCWSEPEAVERLRALEESLGILGAEAARRVARATSPRAREAAARTGIDPAVARAFLDRTHLELRDRVLGLLSSPELAIPPGLDSETYRLRVLEAVRFLARRGLGRLGYPAAYGGAGDPGAAVAVFETLAYGDLSVLVKYGVQFGLFGGSVLQLGTERHHGRYLERIGSLDLPGCYAMTEIAHGSNVRDLETTATYAPETDELIVHTPREEAGKDWIGNGARDGRLATVFARLLVGGEDHGVHAVLVPIRGDDGAPLPGVRVEDRGLKLGLNGVDNGRLWFDRVRVPRGHLLDRFASIGEDGVYRSPIASPGRRFFTMLGTLVAGRISIAAASVSAAKLGLTIAVRRAARRAQFGPGGAPELPVLEYPLVQRALLPGLATTYGLHFAVRSLQDGYARAAEAARADGVDGDAGVDAGVDEELEVAAAALKAYASDHCVATLQACREVCGGEGYAAGSRFAALKADTDVFTTFEGANDVLYQLVAKGLLSELRDRMGDLSLWRAMQYLGERAETTITELNPIAVRRTDAEHLLDPEFHRSALAYREARLLRSAALRIRSRLQAGTDSFLAVTEVQDHLVALARAHAERRILEHFHDGVAAAPTPGLSETLRSLAALYALSRIEADRAWFLESGYVEAAKSRAVRAQVTSLCAELAPAAATLVDAFGIPETLLPEFVRAG